MKQYKSKDFIRRAPQLDTLIWDSSDLKFSITTTTNQYSQYFVYVNLGTTDEPLGIQEDSLSDAIDSLNKMIESGEIEKYIF